MTYAREDGRPHQAHNRLTNVSQNGTTVATFTYAGDSGRKDHGGRKEHLGSTGVSYRASDGQMVRQLYKAWGEVRYSSGSLPTKYTYTGQYSNVGDFGLLFYKSRWVDPVLGRFTSPDSIVPNPANPLDWDRYSYVRNNPLRYVDPSGHIPVSERELGDWINLTRKQAYQLYSSGSWAIDTQSVPNPEKRDIETTTYYYEKIRESLFVEYGFRYINSFGKIDDKVIIAIIIKGEFGALKVRDDKLYQAALGAVSSQYASKYSTCNIQCDRKCSTETQIAWLSDMEAWYGGSIYNNNIYQPSAWLDRSQDALRVMRGEIHSSYWMWGNVKEQDLSRYIGAIKGISLHKDYDHFIVYQSKAR